jgi:hypothetical protein
MNRSTIKAYASSLHSAALSRKAALQIELAVGFAVMLECGPSKRLVRAQLSEIYAQAGYKCREPSDIDWQSIQRRIGASLALYDFIGDKDIKGWIGELSRKPLIEKIVDQLGPLKLSTINEVIQICKSGKEPGQDPRGRKPGLRIETEHLRFNIPASATPTELMLAAGKLMAMAQSMVEQQMPDHDAHAEHKQEELETA